MGFDPVSFSAGIGAGQESANRANADKAVAEKALRDETAHSLDLGNKQLDLGVSVVNFLNRTKVLDAENKALKVEVSQRWIPYAVTLRASLVARKVEREALVDALKQLDPANAEAIVKKADEASDIAFNESYTNPEKYTSIKQMVIDDSKKLVE